MQHITPIWNTAKELSDDIGKPYTTVHSWFARGSIPSKYDLDLIRLAKRRGKKLTLADLAEARRQSVSDVTHNAESGHVNQPVQGVARKNTAAAS